MSLPLPRKPDTLPASFHPLISAWFSETYGKPTAIQAEAWPLIEAGEHTLALAPTGSGKTLMAFLPAISRLCVSHFCAAPGEGSALPRYDADRLTVLYVSPLKALNEDIRRNLLEPLEAIRLRFEAAGLDFPAIRVETRSGDTPQAQRRRFLLRPPSILALTPESLAILLLNPRGRQVLSTVQYLILDEVHAVLGNKRGAFLSCQIDRLALLAGEMQRIGLSATVRSPELAAGFTGGIGRAVRIAAPAAEKQIEFRAVYTAASEDDLRVEKYGRRYTSLIDYVLNRIGAGKTLLVFTGSRRRAERICHYLNQEAAVAHNNGEPRFRGPVAFTHHGSLAKELRRGVEKGLAEGSLPCVVATSSLELGIDVSGVDEVVLAGSPASVSQALQRIGRSGHGVGRTSRGMLFAFNGMDLLLAAALGEALAKRDIEEIHPVENPLDILSQIILALCAEKTRNIDELYTLLKNFYAFKTLDRDAYDRTVYMLAGLGSSGGVFGSKASSTPRPSGSAAGSWRLRELKPRIRLDKESGEIAALDGTLLLLYASGGVIASRGLYSLRLEDGTKIGEMDEEFVGERRLGDCFEFGGRGWRVSGISAESITVTPLPGSADFIPFWRADAQFRCSTLSAQLLALLDQYNETEKVTLTSGAFTPEVLDSLNGFLDSQREAQNGTPLPDRANISVEITGNIESRGDLCTVIIHSFRGGAIHYPLSLALAGEIEETLKTRIETFSNDDGILLLIPRLNPLPAGSGGDISSIETLLRSSFASLARGGVSNSGGLFRKRLAASGVFGAQFREAAERSLVLPKSGFGRRTPLWIMRQRSKRLFDAAAGEADFPLASEAWRACFKDIFDMAGFNELIDGVASGGITLSFFHSAFPSPFARDLVQQETSVLLYDYDDRKDLSGDHASLADKVIEDALGNAALRPPLKLEIVSDFVSRLRRELPGWTPEDADSLCDWVKERVAIPLDEWKSLRACLPEKLAAGLDADPSLNSRIALVTRNGSATASMVHREWKETWEREALALLGPWLRYEGPLSVTRIREVFGAGAAEAEDTANALVEVDEAVRGITLESAEINAENTFCDRENLEMLLRLSRKKARPLVKERPVSLLAPFLALRQGIQAAVSDNVTRNQPAPRQARGLEIFKKLAGWNAPAKLWETEILACRSVSGETIDRKIACGRLVWYGAGKERIGFCGPEDLDLVSANKRESAKQQKTAPEKEAELPIESGFFDRPRDFWEIKDEYRKSGKGSGNSRECAAALWQAVWQGRLSSDSFEPVRRGIEFGFIPPDEGEAEAAKEIAKAPFVPGTSSGAFHIRQPRLPRALRDRWRGGAPVRGKWFSLALDDSIAHNAEGADSSLEEAFLSLDRVRCLLDRWGILCRPLLEHEDPPFSWASLLPAIRRMELSGELIAGRFFAGIDSLQFTSPAVLKELEKAETFTGLYWMNAADPASIAGLDLAGTDANLCTRNTGSRLYYRGANLVAVSSRKGRELRIFIETKDPALPLLVSLFRLPRIQKARSETKILIEKINDTAAAHSEYAGAFTAAGFVSDRGRLCFW